MQRYPSFAVFAAMHGLCRKAHDHWRLTDVRNGHINGLPHSQGRLVATDGILCYIEQADRLFLGHISHFRPDPRERVCPTPKTTKARMSLLEKLLAD